MDVGRLINDSGTTETESFVQPDRIGVVRRDFQVHSFDAQASKSLGGAVQQ